MFRRAAIVGSFVAGAAIVLCGFWVPRARTLAGEQTRTAELQQQEALLRRRLERIEDYRSADGDRRLEHARSALPEEPEVGKFVADHAALASASGVQVLSVVPSPPTPSHDGVEVQLALSLLGPRPRVIEHLRRLEDQPRVVNVADISLTTEGDDRTSATTTVRIFARSAGSVASESDDAYDE